MSRVKENMQTLMPVDTPPLEVSRWATVTQASPLRIKIDTETSALNMTPVTLVSGLQVNDRVRVVFTTNKKKSSKSRRALIIGKADGLPLAVVTSFSPVLLASTSNPTQGSGGSSFGKYVLDPVTRMVDLVAYWQFGSSGAAFGTGNYRFELPHVIDSNWHSNAGSNGLADSLGTALIRDNSVPAPFLAIPWYVSNAGGPNGKTLIEFYTTMATVGQLTSVTPTAPITFAASDAIRVNLRYRIP